MSEPVLRYGGSFLDQPFIPKTASIAALLCPKCGGAFGKPRYCNGHIYSCHHTKTPGGEHLTATCGACGYESVGPCLDAKTDGKPDEGKTP